MKSQHVVGVGLVSQDALGHHLRKAGLASAVARRFLAVADGSPWEGFIVSPYDTMVIYGWFMIYDG